MENNLNMVYKIDFLKIKQHYKYIGRDLDDRNVCQIID